MSAIVVAAPGTQILISLLPILWPRSRVAVLGPTYAEHAHAWRGAGHEVAEISSLDEIGGADILVLVNPNNPDGRTLERAVLLEEAGRLRRRGGWLVVDEAFADFDAGETLVPVLPDNAIVLRSFGKTYGLAGIRLGFAIASERWRCGCDDAGSLGRLGPRDGSRADFLAGRCLACRRREGKVGRRRSPRRSFATGDRDTAGRHDAVPAGRDPPRLAPLRAFRRARNLDAPLQGRPAAAAPGPARLGGRVGARREGARRVCLSRTTEQS